MVCHSAIGLPTSHVFSPLILCFIALLKRVAAQLIDFK